jgi:hypothetical protein
MWRLGLAEMQTADAAAKMSAVALTLKCPIAGQ